MFLIEPMTKYAMYLIINDTNLNSLKQKISEAYKNFVLITQK
ncbi:hypothetical protein IK1_04086 [Bacillus cereus VD146]|uniref:Uncharacterized protein n=1 Tax=Bacillus cereus (strain VD146) TaxID=1053236 RepID=R8NIM7_BACCX|nr:hypothetical protein IK1_04086 [Bacillus cereus VD146]